MNDKLGGSWKRNDEAGKGECDVGPCTATTVTPLVYHLKSQHPTLLTGESSSGFQQTITVALPRKNCDDRHAN